MYTLICDICKRPTSDNVKMVEYSVENAEITNLSKVGHHSMEPHHICTNCLQTFAEFYEREI